MSELHEALAQIREIRSHVSRSVMFRGYRAAAVGATGAVAFVAAATQTFVLSDPRGELAMYLGLWIGAAAVSVSIVAATLVARYRHSDTDLERQSVLRAVEAFVPAIVAGAGVTFVIYRLAPDWAGLLPGLWAVLFSLGVFASWRQLPPASLWVGAYYLAGGLVVLSLAASELSLSPWSMAATFGVGQSLTALVLYLSLERRPDGC